MFARSSTRTWWSQLPTRSTKLSSKYTRSCTETPILGSSTLNHTGLSHNCPPPVEKEVLRSVTSLHFETHATLVCNSSLGQFLFSFILPTPTVATKRTTATSILLQVTTVVVWCHPPTDRPVFGSITPSKRSSLSPVH